MKPIKERIEYGGCLVGQEEEEAILKVIRQQGRRRWTMGPESVAFEQELAKKTGVKYATLTNSGSSALLAGIQACKFPKGSKVIIPALTFPTAYSSILQAGLVPVVVDCNKNTLNLDYGAVSSALEQQTGVVAVLAINIAGNTVDMERLRNTINFYNPNVRIILDNCDGYGGKIEGKFVDAYADVSCISMHAAHIISMGEGGAVLTNDRDIAERVRKIREWGRASGSDTLTKHEGFPVDYRERYVFEEIGYNLKPLELQCAMGRIQLTKLSTFVKERRRVHDALTKIFKKHPQFELVVEDAKDVAHCWFAFAFHCVGIPRRIVMDYLESMNIETRTVFSGNILRHPAYKNEIHTVVGDLNNCDYVMENTMFIGSPPFYTEEQLAYIDAVVSELVKKHGQS